MMRMQCFPNSVFVEKVFLFTVIVMILLASETNWGHLWRKECFERCDGGMFANALKNPSTNTTTIVDVDFCHSCNFTPPPPTHIISLHCSLPLLVHPLCTHYSFPFLLTPPPPSLREIQLLEVYQPRSSFQKTHPGPPDFRVITTRCYPSLH